MKAIALAVLVIASTAAAGPLRAVRMQPFAGICAITDAGTIVCEEEHSLPSLDVVARDFVPGYHSVLVREDGTLVRVKLKTYGDDKIKPEPYAVPFKVQRAGRAGHGKVQQLCMLGEKGELACGPFDVSSTDAKIEWSRVAGRFVDVTFGDDVVWALDDKGALWCEGAGDCGRAYAAAKNAPKKSLLELGATWPDPTATPPDAPMWRVTDGVKRVYATGSPCIERTSDAKTLVCWGFNAKPAVYPRPKGDELASVGAMMCARTGDVITCSIMGSTQSKPFSITEKNVAKMHSGGLNFCVETTKAELRCARIRNPIQSLTTVLWTPRTKGR